jgi:hypothetical protein
MGIREKEREWPARWSSDRGCKEERDKEKEKKKL